MMYTHDPPNDRNVHNGPVSPLDFPTHEFSHSPPVSSVQISTKASNITTTKSPGAEVSQKLLTEGNSVNSAAHFDYKHIHWATPGGLVAFLLLGVASAVAHHMFYKSLDRTPLSEFPQEWAVRIGTGLAFFTKSCLVASAAIAYRQHYWTLLRTQALPVKTIDKVTGILSDPTCFGDFDALRRGWSCMVIALVIW